MKALRRENARLLDALNKMVLCAEAHGWDNAEIHNARAILKAKTEEVGA